MYSQRQIQAAKRMFELHGIATSQSVSDEQAVRFLDFYTARKAKFPCNSTEEAQIQGFLLGKEHVQEEKDFMRSIMGEKQDPSVFLDRIQKAVARIFSGKSKPYLSQPEEYCESRLIIRQVYNSSYFDVCIEETRIGTFQRLEYTKKKYIAISVYEETDLKAPIQGNGKPIARFDDALDAAEYLYSIHNLKQQISS